MLWKLTRHHKDPYDSMVIAQSLADEIPMITYDNVFEKYGVKIL